MKIKENAKTYGIIGLGPFGRELIAKLVDSGEKVIACDKRQDRVDKVLKLTKTTHVVDGYDKATLKKLGFDKCDMVVVCITQSVDISVLTVMTLLNIGVKRVIAKAMSTEHAEVVSKLGAETVYPERDMAIRLANKLQVDAGIDYVELGESINISKIAVPQVFVGKSVIEASVRARFGVNIIAIENKGEVLETVKPEYVFRFGDILYLCGNRKAIKSISTWLGHNL